MAEGIKKPHKPLYITSCIATFYFKQQHSSAMYFFFLYFIQSLSFLSIDFKSLFRSKGLKERMRVTFSHGIQRSIPVKRRIKKILSPEITTSLERVNDKLQFWTKLILKLTPSVENPTSWFKITHNRGFSHTGVTFILVYLFRDGWDSIIWLLDSSWCKFSSYILAC